VGKLYRRHRHTRQQASGPYWQIFSETNLIVLDAQGQVIVNRHVVVVEPQSGLVTIYHGTNPCDLALRTELLLVIYDDASYFEGILK